MHPVFEFKLHNSHKIIKNVFEEQVKYKANNKSVVEDLPKVIVLNFTLRDPSKRIK
jgi:hypothetical protein